MAQRWTGGAQQGAEDAEKIKEFEGRVDKNNPEQVKLLEEMKAHEFALRRHRQNEDPRLSFSTPEFKEASRIFTENFKKNFGKPVEYGLVKQYPWQPAVLMKLDHPVDVDGNPWPLDAQGKPIIEGEAAQA